MSRRTAGAAAPQQEVRFCRSADGTRIAYAVHGAGPPLLLASCWLSHLEFDWQSPVWRHFLDDFGRFATVIRYDERGFGMSDWDVSDFSLPQRVADLEAVADAAGLERFALLGMSQGGPVALTYAARHPRRVTRLVLYGTYATARPASAEAVELELTFQQMIKVGWARPDSTFRRVFTNLMIPGASEEQAGWLDALQPRATSTQNAVRSRAARMQADVRHVLPGLTVPTLVLHARGDRMFSIAVGRELAAQIPRARLVTLDSDNHITLSDELAWPTLVTELAAFLAPDRITEPAPTQAALQRLTQRELDVLRLVGKGWDNTQIARALSLSVRTVERHLTSVYTKLGLTGRSARAGAVAQLLGKG